MRRGLFLAAFMLALLAVTFPLRLALEWADADGVLSASRVEGTIWNGRLRDAQVPGAALGDVSLGVDIASLFTANMALRFSTASDRGMLRRGADGAWRVERSAR